MSVLKTKRRGSLAVLSVALGTFTLVTNEFLPVGLLVDMHRELDVSEGVAGLTLTVPGFVAAISSPAITIGAGRMDRRRLLRSRSRASEPDAGRRPRESHGDC